MSAAGRLFLALAAIIVLARLLGMLARRLGQPQVIGEILAGILIGPTLFGTAIIGNLLPAQTVRPALGGLANAGLVLFMFIVGYELDLTLVRGKGRVAATVSIGSALVPFLAGTGLAVWLATHHHPAHRLAFILFIGTAMSLTAFPVLARILTDRGMQHTQLGSLALASAAVDDVIAWSLLAVVLLISNAGDPDQWHVALAVPYALVVLLLVRPLLRRLIAARERAGRLTPNTLAIVLIGLLLSAYATDWLGVHFIFGAFIFGAAMPRTGGDQLRHEIMERLEQVAVLLLLPAYFVLAGIQVNLSGLDSRDLLELVLILCVAIGGKFAGAYLGARLLRVPSRRAGALATLMNTRGLTELVILTVGLQLGFLDVRLFSIMVVMALVTTMMTGPLLAVVYPDRLVRRDIEEAQQAAMGGVGTHRVMAIVAGDDTDPSVLAVAAALAAGYEPGEVVLSRLIPYRTGGLEVGSGLTGELLEMTTAMAALDRLAAPVRAGGVPVRVTVGFSADPDAGHLTGVTAGRPYAVAVAGHLTVAAALRATAETDVVTVLRALPAHYDTVTARLDSAAGDEATIRVAALLAAVGRATVTLVGRASRPARDTAAAVTGAGLTVTTADGHSGDGVLVAGSVTTPGATLAVTAGRDTDRDEAAAAMRRAVARHATSTPVVPGARPPEPTSVPRS